MNGQAMAQWLVENKNGKAWSKYGKERVYINVYAGGVQVANYFYDIVTDRFFGCDSKTEKAIRNEFEATKTNINTNNNDIEKLQKELETRQSMLRTQMRLNAEPAIIEENKKRIQELEEAIKYEKRYQEAERRREERNRQDAEEQRRWEEQRRTEREEYKRELEELKKQEEATTETEETKKISTVDLQNFLSNKVSSEINAKVELKKIIKIIANKTQQTLQKEEIKEIATNKKISLVFQEQMLLLVFSRLEMTHKIHNLEDWTSNLLYSQDFDEMIKNIKDFIKKGGD